MSSLEEARILLIDTDYDVLEYLGGGTYSSVYKAYDKKSSKYVALKIATTIMNIRQEKYNVANETLAKDFVCPEINSLTILGKTSISSRIPKLYDYFLVEYDNTVYPIISEELIVGITMEEISETWKKNGIDMELFVKIIEEILYLICFMNSEGVYHNDLHLGNLLLSDGIVKIIDFGGSYFKGIETTCKEEFIFEGNSETNAYILSMFFLMLIDAEYIIVESFDREIKPSDIPLPESYGSYSKDSFARMLSKGINQESNLYEMFFLYYK